MSELLESVDARTSLAGNNKNEILLFSLGKNRATGINATYAINVFKVKEVLLRKNIEITSVPDAAPGVEGMISLRGVITPVVKLSKCLGLDTDSEDRVLIVTEYNRSIQAFLVDSVDRIERRDWSKIKEPPEMFQGHGLTSITELEDDRIVQILDVEAVLVSVRGGSDEVNVVIDKKEIDRLSKLRVVFADDSRVARKQVEKVLSQCGVQFDSACNGELAWNKLQQIAASAANDGKQVRDILDLVITDIEMPVMDGYVLTKKIKSDPRFDGVKVYAHSSMTGESNKKLGEAVGVDAYLAKFRAEDLVEKLVALAA